MTVVSFLLQNIAKLRATASMAADDQGIVLNGTANIVSPSSPDLGSHPAALTTDLRIPQSGSSPRNAAAFCSATSRSAQFDTDCADDVHTHSAQVDANTTTSITFPRTPTQVMPAAGHQQQGLGLGFRSNRKGAISLWDRCHC